jgi:hypothetical protein
MEDARAKTDCFFILLYDSRDAVTAIATAFIALFTLTLTLSTRRLWVTTNTAAEKQEESIRILQRAYISTEPFGINPFISEGADKIVGHVAFVNVGRLPARNVSVQQATMNWSANNDLKESDLKITEKMEPAKTVLPPGTKMILGSNNLSNDVLNRDGWIYVWGQIQYTDGFGAQRYTRFCHRYPCQRRATNIEGWHIKPEHARYHQHGNDAD